MSLLSYMGLIYSRAMANYFINQPNYYPETLYPFVTASIGGVKTIRTLRSDAPFTDSDMKSSYLARRGNLTTGERLLRACLDGLRQTQYGLLYTPFLSGLAEVLAPAGRLMTDLLQRTRRCGAPSGATDSAGCPKHCGSKAKPHCCRIKRTRLQWRTISADPWIWRVARGRCRGNCGLPRASADCGATRTASGGL